MSWILVFALLTAKLFPDLPAGRWCQRHLIDAVMALIGKIERRHVLFILFGLIAMQAFAIAMPMDMAFFAAFDVATYVDVLLAVGTVAAMARSRLFCSTLRHRVRDICISRFGQRTHARRRQPRTAGPRRVPVANDEEPSTRALLAA